MGVSLGGGGGEGDSYVGVNFCGWREGRFS